MARIFAVLLLLIATVYADSKHERKKREEASSPEVASKGSEESATKEHAKKEAVLAKKSGKGGTAGDGEAHQGDYQKFMNQFGGDHSKYTGSGSDSSSQSRDWNKYMAQYGGKGGDFKQYMQKYTGGQGAGGMGGNYQQFMKQYAGDYMGAQGKKGESASTPDFQQYMQQADAGPTVLLAEAADAKHESKKTEDASTPEVAEKSSKEATTGNGEAQQGDYQKFMKQFGGDYSKYMGSSDSSSQSGDWNKYMAQHGGQGGDFKQYMQKYAGGQGAGGMGGNYQQFMKQYAGDYMDAQGKKGASASTPDLQQYTQQAHASSTVLLAKTTDSKADAKHESKKTEDASTPEVAEKSSKEATAGNRETQQGDYQQFMKKFGGDYSKYTGSSQSGDWNKYMAQYGGQGGDFKQYMQKYTGGQGAGGMSGNYQQFMKQYAGDYMGAQGKKGESASTPDFQQYMQQADVGPTVLLAEAADAKHESKKTEDGSSPDVAEKSSKEATTGNGEAQQGDYQKFMKQFGGDYSEYMGSSDGSSQSGDWNKYMAQYGGQGGDFKQYMQKYTGGQGAGGMGGNYQQFMKQYAGDYMDAQGKQGESASTPDLQQYMQQADASPSVFLAGAVDSKVSTRQAEAAAEAAEFQAAEGNASSRAQHKVAELKKLAARIEANMKGNVANMVSSIESDSHEAFGQQRKNLEHEWIAKLKALNTTDMATAKWDAVETALDAAADADEKIRSLDWEEFKAMRHAYHERREAKKSQVRSLAHAARRDSRECKHLGRNVEHRQRAAGVKEHVYEGDWVHNEHASEGLAFEVEKAGEDAEEAVEKEFEHVEEHLEKRLDALKESAAREQKARKRAEAKARKDVAEARSAAHQLAKSQASAGSPTLFLELAANNDKDQAAAGDDRGKAATGHSQDKAAEKEPSKQELAQKKLSEATQETEGMVEMLRQLASREHENVERNAQDTVEAIIAEANKKVHEHRQQVEEEWQHNLKALSAEYLAEAEGEAVHKAFEAARHTQDKLSEVDHRQVDAEREAYDQMRRKQDNEVRKIAAQARRASDRMEEFGRRLKNHDAQDKAGRQSERLQQEAEDATDKIEDDVDMKFRLVRALLDKHMREEAKAAEKEQHRRQELQQKAERAVHVARRVARHAAEGALSKASSAPPSTFLARSSKAALVSAELLAAVAFCFGAITLGSLVRAFSSRNVRLNEQPALG